MPDLELLPPPPEQGPWPGWVARWVLPYVEESALWPVFLVLLLHVSLAIAFLAVSAIWRGFLPAWMGLWFFVIGSIEVVRMEWRARKKLGGFAFSVALVWVAAAGLAWLSGTYGLL